MGIAMQSHPSHGQSNLPYRTSTLALTSPLPEGGLLTNMDAIGGLEVDQGRKGFIRQFLCRPLIMEGTSYSKITAASKS